MAGNIYNHISVQSTQGQSLRSKTARSKSGKTTRSRSGGVSSTSNSCSGRGNQLFIRVTANLLVQDVQRIAAPETDSIAHDYVFDSIPLPVLDHG